MDRREREVLAANRLAALAIATTILGDRGRNASVGALALGGKPEATLVKRR